MAEKQLWFKRMSVVQFFCGLLSLAIKSDWLLFMSQPLTEDNTNIWAKGLMVRGVPGKQSPLQEYVTSLNIYIPSFREAADVYVLIRRQKLQLVEIAQSSCLLMWIHWHLFWIHAIDISSSLAQPCTHSGCPVAAVFEQVCLRLARLRSTGAWVL